MPSQDNASQPSPFEITTSGKSKKTNSKTIIIALVIFVFLALGVFVGVLLVRQNQEVREKAAASKCPAAQACPLSSNKNLLMNCTPPEGDNTPAESKCDKKGRIESCGGKDYCCPSVGGSWTTNMTACTVATATAVSTATSQSTSTSAATSTAKSTGTAKATATAKATGTSKATTAATKAPIPETGTEWPTFVGLGLGVLVIVGSLLLAL